MTKIQPPDSFSVISECLFVASQGKQGEEPDAPLMESLEDRMAYIRARLFTLVEFFDVEDEKMAVYFGVEPEKKPKKLTPLCHDCVRELQRYPAPFVIEGFGEPHVKCSVCPDGVADMVGVRA